MAGLFTGTGTYVQITDNAVLDLPSAGWLLQFFLYPNASQNFNAHIYSHGLQGTNVPAIQVILKNTLKIRIIIDWAGGNLVDSTTVTATLVANTWNTLCVSYDAAQIHVGTGQGTPASALVETFSPPAIGTTSPSGNARLGQSTAGGSLNYAGSMGQAFKANITLNAANTLLLAGQFRSPGFFPATSNWQIPMYGSPAFDLRGTLTVAEVSMTYGADGPYMLAQEPYNVEEIVSPLVSTNHSRSYFRAC